MAYVEVDVDVSDIDFDDIIEDLEMRLRRKELKTKQIEKIYDLIDQLPEVEGQVVPKLNQQLVHVMKMEVIDENIDRFSYEQICKMFER